MRIGEVGIPCFLLCLGLVALKRLSKTEKDLNRTRSHILAAQEREPSRVARDIHDGLGQWLSELKLKLEMLDDRAKKNEPSRTGSTKTFVHDVGHIIDDRRRVAHDLSPAILEGLGLSGAMKSHAERVTNDTGIKITVDCDSDLNLSEDLHTIFYRAFQEAVTNAISHSGGTRIDVELRISEHFIKMSVRDNGEGVSKARQNSNGLGLKVVAGKNGFARRVVGHFIQTRDRYHRQHFGTSAMTDPFSQYHGTVRIVIADDHRMFLEALETLFASVDDVELLSISNTGDGILDRVRALRPDVALIDISMLGPGLPSILQELKSDRSGCRVIALTMHLEAHFAEHMLAHGLPGYLVKDAAFKEILLAIKTVTRGVTSLRQEIAELLEKRDASQVDLTSLKMECLNGAAEGLTNNMIGRKLGVSERTVRFHFENIY
ncbi:MAG: response regulator [Pseudomonadota bacterium]